MKVMQIQLEANDTVIDFLRFCREASEEAEIFCLLQSGHKFVPGAERSCDYFGHPLVQLLYYDFKEEANVIKFHPYYRYGNIAFDRNVFVRKSALLPFVEQSPANFKDLWAKLLTPNCMAIHIAEVVTVYEQKNGF